MVASHRLRGSEPHSVQTSRVSRSSEEVLRCELRGERSKMSSKDNRMVVRTGSALRTEVVADGYTMVADEPISLGGTGSGPTPYDYLLAALGACTAMTVRMYAD